MRSVRLSDAESLKNLWEISFGDSREYIDEFFSAMFKPQNTVAIFDGDRAVSALYLIESNVLKDSVSYSAYYIYAVSTHPLYRGRGLMARLLETADELAQERNISYLFLAPAQESLFGMYGKFGFKTGFFYDEQRIDKSDNLYKYNGINNLTFDMYGKCHREYSPNESAYFDKSGFEFFLNGKDENIKCISVDNCGYCVYEKNEKNIIVHELFGDRDFLLNEVFRLSGAAALSLREPSVQGGKPCAMYKNFGNAPELNRAFLGFYGG